jgi:hypothetical protein
MYALKLSGSLENANIRYARALVGNMGIVQMVFMLRKFSPMRSQSP